MPRSTLSSLPVIAAMLLMPLPSEETTKYVSGGEYEAKAFWFSEFDSHAGGDDRAALTQLRLPPKARLSCRLASSTCGKTQRQEIHRPPEAAIEPILSPPLRQQLRYYEPGSINRTIACKRIARSPGERYCRVCNGVVGSRNSG